MALVAYDYGSDEDMTDEEGSESKSKVILNLKNTNSNNSEQPGSSNGGTGLFDRLPQVKHAKSTISEDNDQLEDFIPTVKSLKEKKKVQITIPSLSDFNDLDNEDSVKPKVKPSEKGSGLLGMLPPVQTTPKGSTMFVPNTLTRKPTSLKPSTTTKQAAAAKRALLLKKKALATSQSGAASDSDTDTEDIPVPETFDDKMWEKVCGRPKPKKPRVDISKFLPEQPVVPEEITIAPETEGPYEGLDNVAFKELVGKTKRPLGNIKMIDINEAEILPDKDVWMVKSLTDPDLAPKPAEDEDDEFAVDPTKKRKHHITYLAKQAKANEQELKAAWATSKGNRMMSRAKYGF